MSSFNCFSDFIKKSKTPFHTVNEIRRRLTECGYTELTDADSEAFKASEGKYFVTKNESSLIAFRLGGARRGFMISSSHSDTPTFKVKGITPRAGYLSLAVEKYGGAIHYSWLDKPLSVAGRVVLRTERGIEWRLFDVDRDFAVIPSLAIHLNRNVNDGAKLSPLDDMLPLIGLDEGVKTLEELIAKELSVNPSDVISHDLTLYNREQPKLFGAENKLVLSPRLDDLECTYCAIDSFLSDDSVTDSIPVFALFDNEEVGSETAQGAASTFLADTLLRIAGDTDTYVGMLYRSFMISADNAHAKHPNHPELSDRFAAPTLGGGVVVKYNANRRYATDAVSDAVLRVLAERAGAKLQSFYSRPDLACGSTLGSICTTKVSVLTADVGLAQLAMHSATETAALSDIDDLSALFRKLFSSHLVREKDGFAII